MYLLYGKKVNSRSRRHSSVKVEKVPIHVSLRTLFPEAAAKLQPHRILALTHQKGCG